VHSYLANDVALLQLTGRTHSGYNQEKMRHIILCGEKVVDREILRGILFYGDPQRAFEEMGGTFIYVVEVIVDEEEFLGEIVRYRGLKTNLYFLNPQVGVGWKLETSIPVLSPQQAMKVKEILEKNAGAWESSEVKDVLEKMIRRGNEGIPYP